MTKPFRIGIAGLGTVGAGVVRLLQENANIVALRAGRPVEILCVSARNKTRQRGIDISAYEWLDSPGAMAGDPRLDAVVELIGGAEGTARDLVERTLKAGKAVITANKALLAEQGGALAQMADSAVTCLLYEAAVAGGIPVIKALREGLAGNNIRAVYGILNGTCNYILTAMRETGRDFESVLKEAQEKGYAESDPALDVDGIDAAHKITLLTALAFGVKPGFAHVAVEGIRHISATDITFASELGYRIKLLGAARREENGRITQSMKPCLVPQDSPLGAVDGVFNAVFIDADFAGTTLLAGRGAGAGPTASAVVADIIDLARGGRQNGAGRIPAFGVPAGDLDNAQWGGAADVFANFYLHFSVLDKPGVLADVTAILRDHQISVESVIQRGRSPGQPVSLVLTTHEVRLADVEDACGKIAALPVVQTNPTVMRMVRF